MTLEKVIEKYEKKKFDVFHILEKLGESLDECVINDLIFDIRIYGEFIEDLKQLKGTKSQSEAEANEC